MNSFFQIDGPAALLSAMLCLLCSSLWISAATFSRQEAFRFPFFFFFRLENGISLLKPYGVGRNWF
jgi:hypothetical protein